MEPMEGNRMSATFYEIVSLNVGTPNVLRHGGQAVLTGIGKSPAKRPLYLSSLNLEGDGQADLVHHGGKDKAVCVYSYDHYPHWEQVLGRKLPCASFGENLTVKGIREEHVCIGDIFQLGEAIVQISQPRQPCHKLAIKQDRKDLPLLVKETGFTGFYFRVLREGWVVPEQGLRLLQRHPLGVTVAYANRIMYMDKQDHEGIRQILAVRELSSSWRQTFLKRLNPEEKGYT
jgi:MOSC domain-containing protein YiiM